VECGKANRPSLQIGITFLRGHLEDAFALKALKVAKALNPKIVTTVESRIGSPRRQGGQKPPNSKERRRRRRRRGREERRGVPTTMRHECPP
jgi:hypothetical protein